VVAAPEPRHRCWRAAGRFSLCFVPASRVLPVLPVGFVTVLPLRLLDLTPLCRLLRAVTGCWLAIGFSFNWMTCIQTKPNGPVDTLFIRLVWESVTAGVMEESLGSFPGSALPAASHPPTGVGECAQFLWGFCQRAAGQSRRSRTTAAST
jgi:hypothetical protein